MTDTTLTKDQAAVLLRRLATDDSFRTLFETKPAQALVEAGVSADAVAKLEAKCLSPRKLASKQEYESASKVLDDSLISHAMAMNVPQLKMPK